jgi:large subunit ribosomal protein L30
MLRIVLKRGYAGVPDKQRRVLAALGLKKIGSSVTHQDSKSTKGMILKVAHFVTVETVTK